MTEKNKSPVAAEPPEATPADIFILTTLEQVKVLADPLRVRILEALCTDELTTKQVAQQLGEKPTRLYHHVDALERVGLIRLVRTQQIRGTIEKYYRAVALQFRADADLFTSTEPGEKADTIADVVDTMMTNTAADLRRLIRDGHDLPSGEESILSYTELRASAEKIAELRQQLMDWLKKLEKECCDEQPPEDARRYRFTMAFFPLDLRKDS